MVDPCLRHCEWWMVREKGGLATFRWCLYPFFSQRPLLLPFPSRTCTFTRTFFPFRLALALTLALSYPYSYPYSYPCTRTFFPFRLTLALTLALLPLLPHTRTASPSASHSHFLPLPPRTCTFTRTFFPLLFPSRNCRRAEDWPRFSTCNLTLQFQRDRRQSLSFSNGSGTGIRNLKI